MSKTNKKRDRNFARATTTANLDAAAYNAVAAELRARLPRDNEKRTLPHTLPGCSLTADGEVIPEKDRVPQIFENGADIAVCGVVAKELQKYNTCNRRKNKANVSRLRDAMRFQEWRYNGKSSVLVCSNTAVLDSQHTLAAMCEYFEADNVDHVRTPFLMRVEMGLPPNVFQTLDTGAKRTTTDTLHVESELGNVSFENVPDHVMSASVRLLLQYLNNIYELADTDINYLPGQRSGLINSRLATILNMYPGLIESAQFVCGLKTMSAVVRLFIPVVGHMLITEAQSATAANNFVRSLASGSDLPEGSPIIALRSLYIKGAQNKRRMEGPESLAYFLHAWNKFAAGRSVEPGRLKAFTGHGKIPVPEKIARQRTTA